MPMSIWIFCPVHGEWLFRSVKEADRFEAKHKECVK